MSILKVSPRQLLQLIPLDLQAGLVPFIQGSPGTAKSSVVDTVGNSFNLEVIDHRLSTSEPTDLTGMPDARGDYATFKPFMEFPVEGRELPEGKDGWLLFLDEYNTAPKAVQAAAYKLILDRMVGQHRLHEKVVIVLAGNLTTDRAIVTQLSTASQSRIIHYFVETSHAEFMEDVVYARNWDQRIAAYLEWKPGSLNDFKADHNNPTFCCPRTWEFMQKRLAVLGKGDIPEWTRPAWYGTITPLIAEEFLNFCTLWDKLPPTSVILADPDNAPLPQERELQFASAIRLVEPADENNLNAICRYVNRLNGMEFKTVFTRALLIKNESLRHHPDVVAMMVRLIQRT